MAKFTFGGGKSGRSDEDDEINRKAQRELLEAQERRASEKQTERELLQNPDSAASMEKQFSGQADKEREAKANNDAANERYYQALAAQQKDVSSRGLKGWGQAQGLNGSGQVTGLMGAAEMIAKNEAYSPNYTPKLSIGATAEERKAVSDMSNAMQRHRRQVKEYERRQKEKRKNDGGLTAARQRHRGLSFFPGRPMFKVGSIVFEPMSFTDGVPLVNLHRSCEEGWCAIGSGQTDTLQRVQAQAGRRYRAGLPR